MLLSIVFVWLIKQIPVKTMTNCVIFCLEHAKGMCCSLHQCLHAVSCNSTFSFSWLLCRPWQQITHWNHTCQYWLVKQQLRHSIAGDKSWSCGPAPFPRSLISNSDPIHCGIPDPYLVSSNRQESYLWSLERNLSSSIEANVDAPQPWMLSLFPRGEKTGLSTPPCALVLTDTAGRTRWICSREKKR